MRWMEKVLILTVLLPSLGLLAIWVTFMAGIFSVIFGGPDFLEFRG